MFVICLISYVEDSLFEQDVYLGPGILAGDLAVHSARASHDFPRHPAQISSAIARLPKPGEDAAVFRLKTPEVSIESLDKSEN